MSGTTQRLTESGFMENPAIEPATPGLQGIALIHFTTAASRTCDPFFCGFPGYKPVPPTWFKICVGFITGTPKGSPKVFFLEKPGIEPATPGLQGIALIHYTTAASRTCDSWFTSFIEPLHLNLDFCCLIKIKNMGSYFLIVFLASIIIRN